MAEMLSSCSLGRTDTVRSKAPCRPFVFLCHATKLLLLVLLVSRLSPAWQESKSSLDQATEAYRAGDFVAAKKLLKAVLVQHPHDLKTLVLMGIVLDTEKRYAQAEPFYQQALALAPASSQVLNNVANHYLSSGDNTKAQEFYEKVVAVDVHHENANLQLAVMSLEENQGQCALTYLDRLNSAAASQPATIALRLRALASCGRCSELRVAAKSFNQNSADVQSLFSTGMASAECKLYSEAERAFSRALDRDPRNFEILYNLGLASLRAGDLNRAKSSFETALSVRPHDSDTLHALAQTRVRLAFIDFHGQSAESALRELDKTPEVDRTSDDYLLRAQILDSQGNLTEAAAALNQALRTAPGKATLYHEAVDFLLKHKLYQEAEAFLEEALRIRPNDRDLLLAQALTLNLLRRNTDSEKLLDTMQAKWPDWDRIYLLRGMLLEIELKSQEARRVLEKSIALGANTPEAYYYEALAVTHSAPQDTDAAQNAITHALALTSDDPYIYLLAGNIAVARKDYSTAITRLREAIHLEPSLVPAHYALRHTYTALGDDAKAQVEMQTIKRIAEETHGTDQGRFAINDFLFAVRPPG